MTFAVSLLWIARPAMGLASLVALSACATTADIGSVWHHAQEAPAIYSSPVRNGVTPLTEPLACFGDLLEAERDAPLGIAVGDIKDYTGKQGQDEGFVITQGGALMAYSALGKIGEGVRVHERFDTRIAEAELVYMDRRQLGDGNYHSIDDPSQPGGEVAVPWRPYFGGTIRQSDFFIVGGITELNYNIQSGGGEFAINALGPRARLYTMNVAIDLRIVGSQTLLVYDTVSIEKQLTGYEVGFGVFRFFGNELFDVNVGAKNQEPLQLGVRMAIEAGVLQLVASVADIDPGSCVPPELGGTEWDGAAASVHGAVNQSPLPSLSQASLSQASLPEARLPEVSLAEASLSEQNLSLLGALTPVAYAPADGRAAAFSQSHVESLDALAPASLADLFETGLPGLVNGGAPP